MTVINAAELPEGSQVVIKAPRGVSDSSAVVLTRNGGQPWVWTSGHAGPVYSDDGVQDALGDGTGEVLREGWPE